MPGKKKDGKKPKGKVKEKKPKEIWEDLARFAKQAGNEQKIACKNTIIDYFATLADERKDEYPNQIVIPFEVDPSLVGVVVRSVSLTAFAGITQLRFWQCGFGDAGCTLLCEGMGSLPLVDKLDRILEIFFIVEIMDCRIGPTGCGEIAKVLRRRAICKLKLLKLDHNNLIGDKGLALLAGAFAFNETVSSLSLAYCGIEKGGGKPLAAICLVPDLPLKKLNLEGNELRDEGITDFCEGLKDNKTLTQLNISNNQFGGSLTPVKALIEAFKTCTTLGSINMDGNLIGDEGCKCLNDGLADVKHIFNLEVTEFISQVHFAMLMEWLVANKPKKVVKKKAGKKGSKKK